MIEINALTLEDDVEAVVKAITAASWSEKSEINPTDYSVAGLQACLAQGNHVFCVAYVAGQYAGMASAYVMKKPDGDVWLYVDEVDVCADQQGKGVATALMEWLFAYAKEHKCTEVWLGTEPDNVPAHALYTSLKPTETEDFVGYTFKL